MVHYENKGGNSGVESFEISESSITVKFRSGRNQFYRYDYLTPGKQHVDQMAALANSGVGLNSYISSVVKSNFADKW